jgi:hypothetical protein
MVYADDVNIGRKGTYYEENTENLVVASKETEAKINNDKTKYMLICQDQNAIRSHAINIDNKSFEIMEQFKYWNNPYESKFYSGLN